MARLLAFAEVNFHPLENTATTKLTPGRFPSFIRACGHDPFILSPLLSPPRSVAETAFRGPSSLEYAATCWPCPREPRIGFANPG